MNASELDRLVDIGRRRGKLTIEDIRTILPLDALTIEELARILARLEDSGVTVDIDPALLVDRGGGPATRDVPPLPSDTETARDGRFETLAKSIKAARAASSAPEAPPHAGRPATGTILIALGVLSATVVLAVWMFG